MGKSWNKGPCFLFIGDWVLTGEMPKGLEKNNTSNLENDSFLLFGQSILAFIFTLWLFMFSTSKLWGSNQ